MTTGNQITGSSLPRVGLWFTTSWRWLLTVCCLMAVLHAPALGAETPSKEYQLKAAFLYNFTKFIDWPTNRFTTKDQPLTIGVLGKNPFGDDLIKVVEGRTVNGRTYVVKVLTSVREAASVDLLFVPQGQEKLLADQLPILQGAGVLTVGESDAFAKLGGTINFMITEADQLRFEINLAEAERGGFKIRAQLLKLAKIVGRKS